jgi:hypothetical protein
MWSEKPNKIRGEWLQLVNLSAGNVSFFGPNVDIRNHFRLKNAPVWTAFVDVWTGKVTSCNLGAISQDARRII